jgi:hypothetical protein
MSEAHLSALELDLLDLGGMAPAERTRAEAHLAGCERCRGDLETARTAKREFDERVFLRTVPAIRVRGEKRSLFSWRRLSFTLAPALAAAAAIAIFLRPTPVDHGDGGLGVKGGPAMQVFAQRDDPVRRIFQVRDGDTMRPGDALRFAVYPSSWPYLLVVSVDGKGTVSSYFPFGGDQSGRLDGEARVELPGSVLLDDAPGPERIFAIFSREPLTVRAATSALGSIANGGPQAIRAAKELPVPGAGPELTLVFEKAVP